MNNIFSKNISALSTKNPELAKKIQNHIPLEIPKLVQENGVYNLFYKEKYIHNRHNPLAEAQEIFNFAENSPVAIHLIYGLGLGYLFQITSLKSEGTVILYEPDLNILWISFTLVDFSNDILKNNVFITTKFEETTEIIYQKSGMKNSPTLLSLPSQREYNPEEFEILVKKLQDIIGTYTLNLKYTKEKFYPALKMLLRNIPKLKDEIPLNKFKNIYKDKTAVIVSAGPTLDRNIETIKKHRDKFILFTVGTAAKTLNTHGIKPDFLCIIETFNCSKQIEGIDFSDTNFITEPYSNPVLRNFKFKNTYSHISSNTPINHFWSEICNEDTEEYWSRGTVSYTALNSARILGFSKIILVGQDLAYIEGQCYSKDSAYKDLYCSYNEETQKWEIKAKDFEKFSQAISTSQNPETRKSLANRRLNNLNGSLYYVKGINGNNIPTESVYAAFVKPLSDFTQHFNDRKYINTSLVGAQIDGFENMSLEDALKDSEKIDSIELNTSFTYDIDNIKTALKEKLDELKTALKQIESGKNILKNLNNDIKRYRSVNVEVLKTLKKLSLNYLELSSDFSNKSKLFDFITTAEKIDLDYEMKMLKEFSVQNIENIITKISKYYTNAELRINEVEGIINESINSTR